MSIIAALEYWKNKKIKNGLAAVYSPVARVKAIEQKGVKKEDIGAALSTVRSAKAFDDRYSLIRRLQNGDDS